MRRQLALGSQRGLREIRGASIKQVREPATASNYLFTTEFTGLHALSCGYWYRWLLS